MKPQLGKHFESQHPFTAHILFVFESICHYAYEAGVWYSTLLERNLLNVYTDRLLEKDKKTLLKPFPNQHTDSGLVQTFSLERVTALPGEIMNAQMFRFFLRW